MSPKQEEEEHAMLVVRGGSDKVPPPLRPRVSTQTEKRSKTEGVTRKTLGEKWKIQTM